MTFVHGFTASCFKKPFFAYGAAIVLVVAGLSIFNFFERPNLFMLDTAIRLRGPSEPRQEIAIVAISQRDFEMGAPRWPWPRSLMARLIDSISESEPAVIVVDILYTEPTASESVLSRAQFEEIRPFLYQVLSGTPVEVSDGEGVSGIGSGSPTFYGIVDGAKQAKLQDVELVNAVRSARMKGVDIVMAAHAITGENAVGIARPFPALNDAAGGSIGLVGIKLDTDGILRRYIPYGREADGGFQYALALVAVSRYMDADLPNEPDPDGNVLVAADLPARVQDGSFLVNFRGPPGTHPTFDALDVLKGRDGLKDSLRGKIVFLGVTDPSLDDVLPTPYSGTDRMAGVEFHAAAADTVLSQRFISSTPKAAELILIALLAASAIFLGRSTGILPAIGGYVAIIVTLTGIWLLLFLRLDHVLPVVPLASAASLAFVASLADRVGVEQLERQRFRATLSRYLAPAVVTKMLGGPGINGLGGSRSEISVLFSGIKGFTSISEDLAPEDTAELLNHYLDVMTEVVFRNGGTVNKLHGALISAFFGAPQPQSDHARRAVATALEMIDRQRDLEALWQERTGIALRLGVGIHTGEAFVGNIGSQRRMNYTIIGDTVNLASMLQDITDEYDVSVLLSAATRSKSGDITQFRGLGTVTIRGRRQPVELYEGLARSRNFSGGPQYDPPSSDEVDHQPLVVD